MGMIINPYLLQPSGDADALSFITAANITDSTQKSAIETLVTDLKTYGLWTKMKAIYPFVGGTASTHKWNLKDPRDLDAAFRLTFSGGWTHSSTGVLPNGTNAYANTGLTPNAVLSQNSTHISVYSRTNISGFDVDIGCQDSGGTKSLYILPFYAGSYFFSKLNSSTQVNYSSMPNSLGLLSTSRIVSNQYSLYKNGTNLITGASNSDGLSPVNISLSAFNNNGSISDYSRRELAIASIGDGLNATESANFYTAVQAFQTTLGRQV